MDCLPCIRLRPPVGLYDVDPDAVNNNGESMMTRFMRRVYAPFLLKREVKQIVIAAFGGLFIVAVVGIQRITMGLSESPSLTFSALNTQLNTFRLLRRPTPCPTFRLVPRRLL